MRFWPLKSAGLVAVLCSLNRMPWCLTHQVGGPARFVGRPPQIFFEFLPFSDHRPTKVIPTAKIGSLSFNSHGTPSFRLPRWLSSLYKYGALASFLCSSTPVSLTSSLLNSNKVLSERGPGKMMTDDDVTRGTSVHRSMTLALRHAENGKAAARCWPQNSSATVGL